MTTNEPNPLLCFTPESAEFTIEWLPRFTAAGCDLRPFRLTSTRLADGEVRTYGLFAAPPGNGPFPAVLHIHGGGQTASPENVAYFVARGYAAMSFDWTGPTPQRDQAVTTSFPPSCPLPEDYLIQLGREEFTRNRLYLAWRAARCCLALLRTQDAVAADRVGIHGISWGGFLTWLVNGTDSGVRCAVPVYGTGGLHWPGHIRSQIWAAMPSAARRQWLRCLEPRSYADRQSGPVLHINGSNDFFGGVNVLTELLPLLNCDWRLDLTPNTNHHFSRSSGNLVDAWFDHYLKNGPSIPPAPTLRADVTADRTLRVLARGNRANLALWYSYGDLPHSDRCWCRTDRWETGTNGELSLNLPAVGPTWLYLRQSDPVGQTTQCSLPICVDAPKRTRLPRLARSLYEPGSLDGFGNGGSTELHGTNELSDVLDLGAPGLTATEPGGAFSQVILRTPLRFGASAAGPHTLMELELMAVASLQIDCLCGTTLQPDNYCLVVEQPSDGAVRLNAGDFTAAAAPGKALGDFRRVKALVLSGRSRPNERICVRRIHWATGRP